jgi:hypothetical protein
MLKKMLLVVAVVALLVSAAQAIDTTYKGGKKYDSWPTQYVKQFLCKIPVKMCIPWYVVLKDCDKKVINLTQYICADETKWPCFSGCTKFTVEANFDYILYASLNSADKKMDGSWSVKFTGGDGSIMGSACNTEFEICVDLKRADLHPGSTAEAGTTVEVHKVKIEVIPQGAPPVHPICP